VVRFGDAPSAGVEIGAGSPKVRLGPRTSDLVMNSYSHGQPAPAACTAIMSFSLSWSKRGQSISKQMLRGSCREPASASCVAAKVETVERVIEIPVPRHQLRGEVIRRTPSPGEPSADVREPFGGQPSLVTGDPSLLPKVDGFISVLKSPAFRLAGSYVWIPSISRHGALRLSLRGLSLTRTAYQTCADPCPP